LVLLAFCACGFVPIDEDEMMWATTEEEKNENDQETKKMHRFLRFTH
jgi:hypothetical protein